VLPSAANPMTSHALAHVRESVADIVGGELVAMYVVGSTAQHDRVTGSDLDLLVVVTSTPQRPWLAQLAEAVVVAAKRLGERVELVVQDAAAVAHPHYPMPYVLNVNADPGPEAEPLVRTSGDPPHWFFLDAAMAREHALPLHGPKAAEVLGEPSRADVARAIVDALDWHAATPAQQGNAVLNACRAWRFLAGAGWSSKTQAGQWAVPRWDDPVIERALAARRGQTPTPTMDPGQVDRLHHHVRALALAARSGE